MFCEDKETFFRKNVEFKFNDKLFETFERNAINKSSFLNYNISKLMLDLLNEFYKIVEDDHEKKNEMERK